MRFKVVIPARHASTRLPGKPLLDLGGKPIAVYEVGPDGANYIAESSGTNDAITFTIPAGRSRDIDPGANPIATFKFVCATATNATTTAFLRAKR